MIKENKNGKSVTHKIKFIYSVNYMCRSLLSLNDILTEGFKSGLEYPKGKDSTLKFKCLDCNKNHEKKCHEVQKIRKRISVL